MGGDDGVQHRGEVGHCAVGPLKQRQILLSELI